MAIYDPPGKARGLARDAFLVQGGATVRVARLSSALKDPASRKPFDPKVSEPRGWPAPEPDCPGRTRPFVRERLRQVRDDSKEGSGLRHTVAAFCRNSLWDNQGRRETDKNRLSGFNPFVTRFKLSLKQGLYVKRQLNRI
ncbi:hypothetical protein WNZ15_14385 [Roseibium sp. AS2]|uniref:hypothetical protein n=1 Tax=Roseibium sp. AS2 TaxID=3135781 RepID=UPI00317EAC10